MQNTSKNFNIYYIVASFAIVILFSFIVASSILMPEKPKVINIENDCLDVNDIELYTVYDVDVSDLNYSNYDLICLHILLELNNVKVSNDIITLMFSDIESIDDIDSKMNSIVILSYEFLNNHNLKLEIVENYPFEFLETPCLVWLQKDYIGTSGGLYPSVVVAIDESKATVIDPILGKTEWKFDYIRSQYNQAGRKVIYISCK